MGSYSHSYSYTYSHAPSHSVCTPMSPPMVTVCNASGTSLSRKAGTQGSLVHTAQGTQQRCDSQRRQAQGRNAGVYTQSHVKEARVHQLQQRPLQQKQQQDRADHIRRQRPSSEKYLLLPEKHVLEQQLSDHMPQIFTCGAMTGRVRVLTWNIMTQCRFSTSSNNGFGKNERGDEYLRRLQDIAHVVGSFFAQGDTGLPMVAVLQECPLKEEDLQVLIGGIRHLFPAIGYEKHQASHSVANVTLCDKSQWRLQQMPARVGLLQRALITKLVPVQGRVHGAMCPPCTFVNVHLEWKANPHHMGYNEHAAHVGAAVGKCLNEDGLVVVVGDFNMNVLNLVNHFEKEVVVDQIPNSSQVWKNGNASQNTVDGVIWSDTGNTSLGDGPSAYKGTGGASVSRGALQLINAQQAAATIAPRPTPAWKSGSASPQIVDEGNWSDIGNKFRGDRPNESRSMGWPSVSRGAQQLVNAQQTTLPKIIRDVQAAGFDKYVKQDHWAWYMWPTTKEGFADPLKVSVRNADDVAFLMARPTVAQWTQALELLTQALNVQKSRGVFPTTDHDRIDYFIKEWSSAEYKAAMQLDRGFAAAVERFAVAWYGAKTAATIHPHQTHAWINGYASPSIQKTFSQINRSLEVVHARHADAFRSF